MKRKQETTQGPNVSVGEIYDYNVGSYKKVKNSMIKDLKTDNDYKKSKRKSK